MTEYNMGPLVVGEVDNIRHRMRDLSPFFIFGDFVPRFPGTKEIGLLVTEDTHLIFTLFILTTSPSSSSSSQFFVHGGRD